MAIQNILCVCVLIAAVATGDGMFSNLMNHPLKFAVSLLDGPASSRSTSTHYTTVTETQYPTTEMTATEDDNVYQTLAAKPRNKGAKNNLKMKLAAMRDAASSWRVPKTEALLGSGEGSHETTTHKTVTGSYSDSSESGEIVVVHAKKARPSAKRVAVSPLKKFNNRFMASSSHQQYQHIHAKPVPQKTFHKFRMQGWKKNEWTANRSSGSDETAQKFQAGATRSGETSSSSEEVVIVKKVAKPIRGTFKRYGNRSFGQRSGDGPKVQSLKRISPVIRSQRGHCRWCHSSF